MTKIKTYEDLLLEEKRLEAQLASYKLIIQDDFTALKDGLNPVKKVMDTVKKLFTRDVNAPLVNFGVNFGIDLFIRRMLLGKASWVLKFLVPFVMKNFTSHIIADGDKAGMERSVKKFFKKIINKFSKADPVPPVNTTF